MTFRTKNAVAVKRRIRGQGMTEYIIILTLIAVAAIASVGAFGGVIKDYFTGMAERLSGGAPAAVQVQNAPATGSTEGSLGRFQ